MQLTYSWVPIEFRWLTFCLANGVRRGLSRCRLNPRNSCSSSDSLCCGKGRVFEAIRGHSLVTASENEGNRSPASWSVWESNWCKSKFRRWILDGCCRVTSSWFTWWGRVVTGNVLLGYLATRLYMATVGNSFTICFSLVFKVVWLAKLFSSQVADFFSLK